MRESYMACILFFNFSFSGPYICALKAVMLGSSFKEFSLLIKAGSLSLTFFILLICNFFNAFLVLEANGDVFSQIA